MAENIETTCAVVRLSDGLIINAIVASPSDVAPDGCKLVEIMNGQLCDIGWYYIDGEFRGPRTYAMCRIDNGEVVSFFNASYVSPIPATPDGYIGIEVLPEVSCGIGWTWDGAKFNSPTA